MDVGSTYSLDFADGDTDDLYEVVLLPDRPCSVTYHPPDPDRLSPCHAILPPSPKLALANIQDFVETTIVLKKDKNNDLGLVVTGGNDTYLEQICVINVLKDGAAYKDGRVKKGDVLLAVNDISMRDVSFSEAVSVLREARSPLRLLVLRENPQSLFTTQEDPTKFITVEMRKASIKDRLGISIVQRTNGRGVFVTYIQPGSIAAHHCRRIMQGDQILEINGQNVRESNQKDVASMLENLDGAIVLLLGRVPSLATAIQEWARRKAQQSLRTRTSTWSAYTGNAKEKLNTQRPSLPVSKESCSLSFQSAVLTTMSPTSTMGTMHPSSSESKFPSRDASPNSSLRRSRLSIVAEDLAPTNVHKVEPDSGNEEELDIDEFNVCGSENPLLPSIRVTSF